APSAKRPAQSEKRQAKSPERVPPIPDRQPPPADRDAPIPHRADDIQQINNPKPDPYKQTLTTNNTF
ncbi:hypothetical protein AAHH78_35625, partial [Burkholderia pseudomallei]